LPVSFAVAGFTSGKACGIRKLLESSNFLTIGKRRESGMAVIENDIVLIHFEDQPLVFARIEDIQADVKPGWYLVKLLMLQVPLQVVTWILRDIYIEGAEFTMNGKRMRLEKVICPEEPDVDQSPAPSSQQSEAPLPATQKAKVISLSDHKKDASPT
jgi:hypothetical protein